MPVNEPPVAFEQQVVTEKDVPAIITLIASDLENVSSQLNFNILEQPRHGTLSATGSGTADWIYTPDLDFVELDRFKFTITDRGDPDGCYIPGPGCSGALTSLETSVEITTSAGLLITDVSAESNSTNEVDEIGEGIMVYTDRDYAFTDVPDYLKGQVFIRTANDDKGGSSPKFLSFILQRAAVVYIAYDHRAETLPGWLDSEWKRTPDIVGTTDVPHRVFRREFQAGLVHLGGNSAPPSQGANSNYVVIAIPAIN